MLEARDWRPAPDDSMESWCLLLLQTVEDGATSICGWQLGFGNAARLVRAESASASAPEHEPELLCELVEEELDPLRHGNPETTVITPDDGTLQLLRTRLLHRDIDATLRGLSHVSIEAVVEEYFTALDALPWPECLSVESCGVIQPDPSSAPAPEAIEALWEFWMRLGPLVPRRALTGTPL